MFSNGPKYPKLITNLRLAINRLKLLEKKKAEMAVKARREIADYIKNGKEDRARIRVEHIVREDYLVEAMEIIEMYCDLLLARMGVIQTTKGMDDGLEEPIASILWATPRLQSDVQELLTISDQLSLKYGKEYVTCCRSNTLNNVNEKLIHKLSIHSPPKVLVEKYMEEIARSFNIPYVSPIDPECQAADVLFDKLENFINDNKKGDENNGSGGGISFPHIPNSNTFNGYPNPNISQSNVANQPFQYPPQVKPLQENNFNPLGPTNYQPPYPLNNVSSYPMPQNQYNNNNNNNYPMGGLPYLPEVPPSQDLTNSVSDKDEVNFDELSKRFEDLKKKK